MRRRAFALLLKLLHAYDRARLRLRTLRQPGLEVHPDASGNFAAARISLASGARLRIGARAVTERRRGALAFVLGPGAVVEVGEGAWLRTEAGPVSVFAFEGARVHIGPDAFVNGAYLSAKCEVHIGRHSFIGLGSRVFDSDQHDLDAERPEQSAPVRVGDHVWIAADATVLRGVTVGEHSVVGTRSLVVSDVPPHTLAYGSPARAHGPIGDRTRAR